MKTGVATLKMLIVGDVRQWLSDGRDLPRVSQVSFVEFGNLSRTLLDDIAPDMVLSPLVSGSFDALDVAMRLHDLGYDGRMRAISPPLPDPVLVVREVHLLCPSLDFDLL